MNSRTISLLGEKNFLKLKNAKVIVVGLGGVGGHIAEMLFRSGITNLMVIDGNDFEISNLNRQILSTKHNIGENKAEAFKKRANDISSAENVVAIPEYITSKNIDSILNSEYDFIIDAIDNSHVKLELIAWAKENKVKCISAMGTGNRYSFCEYKVTDISKTSGDKLAKKMRNILKKYNIKDVKVVSTTTPCDIIKDEIASIAYNPALCASTIVSYVVNALIE